MHTKDGPSLCLGCELCWGKELQVFSPLLGMSSHISANEFVLCGGPYSNCNLNNVDMILMQFYTFLETTVVAVSLFPAFLVFFTDGDDEITVSLGSLAATFIAFSESMDT